MIYFIDNEKKTFLTYQVGQTTSLGCCGDLANIYQVHVYPRVYIYLSVLYISLCWLFFAMFGVRGFNGGVSHDWTALTYQLQVYQVYTS